MKTYNLAIPMKFDGVDSIIRVRVREDNVTSAYLKGKAILLQSIENSVELMNEVNDDLEEGELREDEN